MLILKNVFMISNSNTYSYHFVLFHYSKNKGRRSFSCLRISQVKSNHACLAATCAISCHLHTRYKWIKIYVIHICNLIMHMYWKAKFLLIHIFFNQESNVNLAQQKHQRMVGLVQDLNWKIIATWLLINQEVGSIRRNIV